jgi:hypothetical protein
MSLAPVTTEGRPTLDALFDLCRDEDAQYLHIDVIVDNVQVQRVSIEKHHLLAYRDAIQGRAWREQRRADAGEVGGAS